MSHSQKLLQEVKDDLQLEKVRGGECNLTYIYFDFMNDATGGCHNHSFCRDNDSSGPSGNHICTNR